MPESNKCGRSSRLETFGDIMKLKQAPKHPLYHFFKDRGIPTNVIAHHIGIKPNRLYQILNMHTSCPTEHRVKLERLVRQIKASEGHNGQE